VKLQLARTIGPVTSKLKEIITHHKRIGGDDYVTSFLSQLTDSPASMEGPSIATLISRAELAASKGQPWFVQAGCASFEVPVSKAVDRASSASDVLGVMRNYILRLLPQVGSIPVDVLIEVRSSCEDSLAAFQHTVNELLSSYSDFPDDRDSEEFLKTVSRDLDVQYASAAKQVRSPSVRSLLKESMPRTSGAYAAVLTTLGLASASPALSIKALTSVTTGQAVSTCYTYLKERRKAHSNPFYWRFQLDKHHRPATASGAIHNSAQQH
jgi:hypothetical protein